MFNRTGPIKILNKAQPTQEALNVTDIVDLDTDFKRRNNVQHLGYNLGGLVVQSEPQKPRKSSSQKPS